MLALCFAMVYLATVLVVGEVITIRDRLTRLEDAARHAQED